MLGTLFSTFLDEAMEAGAIPQLGRAFSALAERYGYTEAIILDAEKLGGDLRPAIVFTTSSRGSVVSYDKRQPFSRHPIYERAQRSDAPFDLEDLRRELGKSEKVWLETLPPTMREAVSLSLPVHRAERLVMFVGVYGTRPDDALLSRATLHAAAHIFYDRFLHIGRGGSSHEPLTNREAECIRWIGLGKTDREISDIIGISERTVRYHARNAKVKLGVSTRVEAIAKLAGAVRGKQK